MRRSDRKWFEDGQVVVLDKSGVPTRVYIEGISSEYRGELIYAVREVETGEGYPAGEKNLKAELRKVVKA